MLPERARVARIRYLSQKDWECHCCSSVHVLPLCCPVTIGSNTCFTFVSPATTQVALPPFCGFNHRIKELYFHVMVNVGGSRTAGGWQAARFHWRRKSGEDLLLRDVFDDVNTDSAGCGWTGSSVWGESRGWMRCLDKKDTWRSKQLMVVSYMFVLLIFADRVPWIFCMDLWAEIVEGVGFGSFLYYMHCQKQSTPLLRINASDRILNCDHAPSPLWPLLEVLPKVQRWNRLHHPHEQGPDLKLLHLGVWQLCWCWYGLY